MISHERAEQLISARMDAPLTPGEHHELQAHLAACPTCRVFVMQADDISRGLTGMTRLAPSPAVSRAVMSHVHEQQSGWAWLRTTLQALSSPGMAAVASMALIVALAGVLYVAVNAPGRVTQTVGQGVASEETIAAIADAPLPTEIPTRAPEPKATEAPAVAIAPTKAPEPTATREARMVQPAATKAPATKTPVTPTPVPVATEAPADEQPDIQQVDSPPIQPVDDGPTYEEPSSEDPALAMASEPAADQATVELAQEADPNAVDTAPVEEAQGTEPEPVVDQVSDAPADDTQVEQDNSAPTDDGSQDGVKDEGSSDVASDPEPTRPTGTLPLDTIAALNGVQTAPDVSLPPPPMDPMQPDQSFLPVTPTPVSDGTPTPEQGGDTSGGEATGGEAPQLAEAYDDGNGITALLPDSAVLDPAVAEAPVDAPADTWTETTDERNRDGKKDRDRKKGGSYENPQTAWGEDQPLAWTGSDSVLMQQEQPVVLAQESDYPVEAQQTTDDQPVYDDGTGTTDPAVASDGSDAAAPADGESADAPQIDPATGMAIDPATGYLIDPNTGYLLDRVNGRVIDPRTSYEVHVQTGLLIDPATGALLDPNTLQVVVPAGFFDDDTPNYDPNDPAMRGEIETVVDDNYNNASIKMEPPTDGPVQPVGPITVPTEAGDSVEIS
ncbi:MAG: zf-HC2 domain-containing protein [Thermomicrobiales bacterium]